MIRAQIFFLLFCLSKLEGQTSSKSLYVSAGIGATTFEIENKKEMIEFNVYVFKNIKHLNLELQYSNAPMTSFGVTNKICLQIGFISKLDKKIVFYASPGFGYFNASKENTMEYFHQHGYYYPDQFNLTFKTGLMAKLPNCKNLFLGVSTLIHSYKIMYNKRGYPSPELDYSASAYINLTYKINYTKLEIIY